MNNLIPSAAEVAAELAKLSRQQVETLADLAGVPFRSLWKVRTGETANPGIDTVRKFVPHLKAAAKAPAKRPRATPAPAVAMS